LTKHNIAILSPMMNEKKFQELGPELQQIIIDNIGFAQEMNDKEVIQREKELEQYFRDEGLIVIDDPDIAAFKENMMNYLFNETKLTETWDMELFERIAELAPSNQ
jgi:TRAP-type C4-dicarboxylate transport system substrate-binding protein